MQAQLLSLSVVPLVRRMSVRVVCCGIGCAMREELGEGVGEVASCNTPV